MKHRINLTKHSKERAWERFQMDASSLKFHANKALEQGINILLDETLRPMYLRKALKNDGSIAYLLEDKIYVFQNESLVTVMPLSYLS